MEAKRKVRARLGKNKAYIQNNFPNGMKTEDYYV